MSNGGGLFSRLRSWLRPGPNEGPPSGSVMLWLLRGCFIALMIGMAVVAFGHFNNPGPRGEPDPAAGYQAFIVIIAMSLLIVASDIFVRNKQITTISAVYFGLLMGLLLGTLFSLALEPFLPTEWERQFPARIKGI